MRRKPKGIRNQTRNHDADSINRQRETQIPQQSSSPVSRLMRIAHDIALRIRAIELVFVVLVFDETLMVRGIWVGDLVVEEPWENEGYCRGARAAYIREDFLERGDCHGCYEGEDDEDGCDDGEADVAHFVGLVGVLVRVEELVAGGRGVA